MAGRNDTRTVLERELTEAFAALAEPTRTIAIEKFVRLISQVSQSERMRCVDLCRTRAQMWRTTRMARDESHAAAVLEARARANEADFLADALEVPAAAGEDS